MSNSLLAIRSQSEAGMADQKRLADRKKSAIVLIHDFLIENGYCDSASRLFNEATAVTSKYASADNIDLMLIISEFEAYYEMKFDKKPKLLRKIADDEIRPPSNTSTAAKSKSSTGAASTNSKKPTGSSSADKLPSVTGSNNNSNSNSNPQVDDDNCSLGVTGTGVSSASSMTGGGGGMKSKKSLAESDNEDIKMLRPPPQFGGDPGIYIYSIIGTNHDLLY